jgi:hypothetical protein
MKAILNGLKTLPDLADPKITVLATSLKDTVDALIAAVDTAHASHVSPTHQRPSLGDDGVNDAVSPGSSGGGAKVAKKKQLKAKAH